MTKNFRTCCLINLLSCGVAGLLSAADPLPIEPVKTNIAGFLGTAERGPTTPQLVTSWLDFQQKYGSHIADSYLSYAVEGFFINGGKRCYVGRITPGSADAAELKSTSNRTSILTAFKNIDEISILNIPNADPDLVKAAIAHCEERKDCFVLVDMEKSIDVTGLIPQDKHADSGYAALYYPWIRIMDPVTSMETLVPPGGYVAGIFARNDEVHGVHKAPANQVVGGAVDLEFQITKGEQDILNPRGVNVIRRLPGRGILVWGARTLSRDPLWKYINVRRLFMYLEESIEEGTQWVASEPNDEELWKKVRANISEFLTRRWKEGAFMGRTPDEAFFVKCDRTTMTQDDIENGRLICLIGVAPVRPAEFVIFRIGESTCVSPC